MIFTSVILPLIIMGLRTALERIEPTPTFGLLWKLMMSVTPYPTPPSSTKTSSICPNTIGLTTGVITGILSSSEVDSIEIEIGGYLIV